MMGTFLVDGCYMSVAGLTVAMDSLGVQSLTPRA